MKAFNAPEFEITKFNMADVITTSPVDNGCGEFEGCPDDTCID